MRTMMAAVTAMAVAAGWAVGAPAMAETAPACTTAVPAPDGFAAMAKPVALADGGTLAIGQAATLALVPDAHFAVAPGHAPAPGRFGGTLRFAVATAGTYRVGLGAGVWIDVVQGGKSLASTAHDHGPACSPVRKIVDFALVPGTYALQISGSTAPAVGVLVIRR